MAKSNESRADEYDLVVAKSHDGMHEGDRVHVVGRPDDRTAALLEAGYFITEQRAAEIPQQVTQPEGGGPADAVRG